VTPAPLTPGPVITHGNGAEGQPQSLVFGVGIDLVQVDRLSAALVRQPSLRYRLFTSQEWGFAHRSNAGADDSSAQLAMFFAAKESVMKALGRGMNSMGFTEIEVQVGLQNQSRLHLSGRAAQRATELGIESWQLSLARTELMAQAVVIALSQ